MAHEGRIGVMALYANTLTGLCSHATACHLFQWAADLHRLFGVRFSQTAMLNDVPAAEASLPMIAANSGIRYLAHAVNNDHAPIFQPYATNNPCWWEGPDGGRVLPCSQLAADPGFDQDSACRRDATFLGFTVRMEPSEAASGMPRPGSDRTAEAVRRGGTRLPAAVGTLRFGRCVAGRLQPAGGPLVDCIRHQVVAVPLHAHGLATVADNPADPRGQSMAHGAIVPAPA